MRQVPRHLPGFRGDGYYESLLEYIFFVNNKKDKNYKNYKNYKKKRKKDFSSSFDLFYYYLHHTSKMPNYTKNTLVVKGDTRRLHHFYKYNRIDEEDSYALECDVCDLSFRKSVPREIDNMIWEYIHENYISKRELLDSQPKIREKLRHITDEEEMKRVVKIILSSKDQNYNNYDLICHLWGTKWDACDSKANLSEIDENGILTYHFDTAWCYPRQWLLSVSKIFPKLTFDIIYTNEDDEYDMVYEKHFENGKETDVTSYSSVKLSIEKAGGVEKLVNDIITIFENGNLMMETSGMEKVHWLEYCRQEWEKPHLVSSMMEEHEIQEEFELSHRFCFDPEFEKVFREKIQKKLVS